MGKQIFFTDDEYNQLIKNAHEMVAEQAEILKKRRFQTDEDREMQFTIRVDKRGDDRKVEVFFTPTAWSKMYALVTKYSTEIEWHGTAERLGDTAFLIKDILIFPHKVTGTTVISDQQEYNQWLDSLDDETFNSLRFHGHSHVNMGVTPSSVDMEYRKSIINNFPIPSEGTDYFYLFVITNKRGEISGQVFDLTNNVVYTNDSTNKEIRFDVQFEDGDSYMSEFMAEARSVVKDETRETQYVMPGSKGTHPYYNQPQKGSKANARQSATQIGIYDDEQDDAEDWDGDYYPHISGGIWRKTT